jgi:hypothetical protein
VANGAEILKVHAAIRGRRVSFTAVDDDGVPAESETSGDFFGEGLKSPVIGGNASRS